jgi:ABC-type uncharacterized transport system substrate-binding protein
MLGPEVAGKRIELLKEIIPHAAKVAAFWNPDEPGARFSLTETQAASTSLGLNLRVFETRDVADLDSAFSGATKEGDQAVILLPAPFMGRNAERIAEAFDTLQQKQARALYVWPDAFLYSQRDRLVTRAAGLKIAVAPIATMGIV